MLRHSREAYDEQLGCEDDDEQKVAFRHSCESEDEQLGCEDDCEENVVFRHIREV